ncbi:hypothetical protein BV898_19876 [Hypsibius exemplaris]|uniref:Uncharacterized protein n=1 Tax=Hypsibius exemplaris TaxID=2072580 RepID=A0A9X6RQ13_HYPEX|nr:hypothetical protein BV898_19876 [Hypsibius exemplaris]
MGLGICGKMPLGSWTKRRDAGEYSSGGSDGWRTRASSSNSSGFGTVSGGTTSSARHNPRIGQTIARRGWFTQAQSQMAIRGPVAMRNFGNKWTSKEIGDVSPHAY